MLRGTWSRRQWLRLAFYGAPALALVDGGALEPRWLAVRRLRLGPAPWRRLVHFSDLHFKGDTAWLDRVLAAVAGAGAELACFTGDLVEDLRHLPPLLERLARLPLPLYGVPGNHEHWHGVPAPVVREAFRATGGDWLEGGEVPALGGALRLVAHGGQQAQLEREAADFALPGRLPANVVSPPSQPTPPPTPPRQTPPAAGRVPTVVLGHYPLWLARRAGPPADLLLAGHSHGGQIRIPFVGAPVVPFGVGPYVRGLYATPAGPLNVSAGIGTFFLPMRFACRPEITVVDLAGG